MSIRLALVNDYEVVVRGLASMLHGYDEIDIVDLAAREPVTKPVDIALFDTFAQPRGATQAVASLVNNPRVRRVAVYTWAHDPRQVEEILGHGVSGYLSKRLNGADLVLALRRIHAGELVVSAAPVPTPSIAGEWPGKDEGLSAREAEVLALITQGATNDEVADKLDLSINTVKTYIRTAYRKIGATSRTNAVLWGLEHGLAPDRVQGRVSD